MDVGLRDERIVMAVLAADGVDEAVEDRRAHVVAWVRERGLGRPRRPTAQRQHVVVADVLCPSQVRAAEVVQLPTQHDELPARAFDREQRQRRVGVGRRRVAPDLAGPEDLAGLGRVLDVPAGVEDVGPIGGHAGVGDALRKVRDRRPGVGRRVVDERATGRRAARLRAVEATEHIQLPADDRALRLGVRERLAGDRAPADRARSTDGRSSAIGDGRRIRLVARAVDGPDLVVGRGVHRCREVDVGRRREDGGIELRERPGRAGSAIDVIARQVCFGAVRPVEPDRGRRVVDDEPGRRQGRRRVGRDGQDLDARDLGVLDLADEVRW